MPIAEDLARVDVAMRAINDDLLAVASKITIDDLGDNLFALMFVAHEARMTDDFPGEVAKRATEALNASLPEGTRAEFEVRDVGEFPTGVMNIDLHIDAAGPAEADLLAAALSPWEDPYGWSIGAAYFRGRHLGDAMIRLKGDATAVLAEAEGD